MHESVKIPRKVIAAVVATGLMSFCGVIVETAMNISFPKLMAEFNVTTNVVQWMTSIYLLIVAIIVPLSALLKKSFPTKKIFLVANLLFISGVVIDGLAQNFPLLLLGRAIQGVGTGIALPLMFNIIMEQVPREKIGLMMGFGNLITGDCSRSCANFWWDRDCQPWLAVDFHYSPALPGHFPSCRYLGNPAKVSHRAAAL